MYDKYDNRFELCIILAKNILLMTVVLAAIYFTENAWCLLGLGFMASYSDDRFKEDKEK